MKLYTLEYNCNVPTTQQINVPTNTDYKVGIKVKRNGKGVNLKPAEVTIGTLSADDGLVNGYLTFTASAGDDPSMSLDTIDIKHGYDDAAVATDKIENTSGSQMTNVQLSCSAEDLDIAGKTLKPTDLKVYGFRGSLASMPSEAQMALSAVPYYDIPDNAINQALFQPASIISGESGDVLTLCVGQYNSMLESYKSRGMWKESDGPVFIFRPTGTLDTLPIKEYTFKGNEVFYTKPLAKMPNNNGAALYCSLLFGEPFDQKFKLTTNVFKSQQGDIAGAASSGTVTLAGAYSDDTEFSYDLLKA